MITTAPRAPAPSATPSASPSPPRRNDWFHPLEVIPLFSRWRPGFLRDLVYTCIFNTLIAVGFTALNVMFGSDAPVTLIFLGCLVFSQCIGFTIWSLIAAVDAVFFPDRRDTAVRRWVLFAVIPLCGAYIGYWIASWLLGWTQVRADLLTWRGVASVLAVSGIITLVLLAIFLPRERAARAEARAARDDARVSAAEREVVLARMKLLEAQVEPHFLFNTLAHVMSLVDTEPALAKRMLHRLIDLLRETAVAGSATSTLRSQGALLRAYLELVGVRMGSRLAWSIEIDPAVADAPIAPMLLQPVVENAIKHGIEPKIDGGRVDVRAARRGDRLRLEVADTGLGVAPTRDPRSTGLGLANLRARLAAVYGGEATVSLADNAPQGTVVTIDIPQGGAACAQATR